MKKLLFPILFLVMAISAMSQGFLSVHGTVTDLATGNPIPNQAVIIHNDSVPSGGYFYHTVLTNSSGFYQDSIPLLNGGTSGNLYVGTVDCQNLLHVQSFVYGPPPGQTNFTVSFAICYSSNPCQASFTSQQSHPLLVQFTDLSVGGGTLRQWDFGDGTTSTQMNPWHLYSAPGYYTVSLTIGAQGTTCYNIWAQPVYVWDTIGTNCLADFTVIPDSMNTLNTFHFIDQSSGNINSWSWNFGDPGSGANNTSTIQNATHTYSHPGVYYTCLTIHGVDTTCYDTYCAEVFVAAPNGCNAEFTYYTDSLNSTNTIHFIDQSTAGTGNIATYLWNFGDGQVMTITHPGNPNVVHSYAQPGTYNVCLTIQGTDSTCYDMTCEPVTIETTPNCHADFIAYADSGSMLTYAFVDQSNPTTGTRHWNFGDGTTSNEHNPQHIYSAAGIYTVCLTMTDANGTCTDTNCDSILVGGVGCQAIFTAFQDSMPQNSIRFLDYSTGMPVYWHWNFGDGTDTTYTTKAIVFHHVYALAGTYIVSLTTQGQGCSSTTSRTVIVSGNNTGCQANFSYAMNPSIGSYVVHFTDLSVGNPTAWQWSFGDGHAGSVQNPVHTYSAPGTYAVCLTIAGNNCTSIFCQNVVIQDSISFHQVYGQVFEGNFPLGLGLAMIFSFDTIANYQPFVAVCPIDSNGIYYFTQVPDGNYYLMAMPFDSSGYLPTYYGNTISWEQATLITLGTANNPYNINLVQSYPMTPGAGSTSGQINTGDVSSSMTDKINMILMNSQSQAIGYTRVSASGTFSFPSMAYGTYYLHPEMPGVSSDVIMVTLTAEKPHADVVMTFSGNKILGLRDEATIVNRWSVYPNPVTDILMVAIEMKQRAAAEARIYNMAGQIVAVSAVILQEGPNTIKLSTTSLPAGVYTLRFFSKEGININTKLVKTR